MYRDIILVFTSDNTFHGKLESIKCAGGVSMTSAGLHIGDYRYGMFFLDYRYRQI